MMHSRFFYYELPIGLRSVKLTNPRAVHPLYRSIRKHR